MQTALHPYICPPADLYFAGTVLEALLAWAVLPTLGWRWLLALSALPLLVLLALFPLLPESPHWLVAKGQYAEAEAVLQRMAVLNGLRRPLHLHLEPAATRAATEGGIRGNQLPASCSGDFGGGGSGMRSRSPAVGMKPPPQQLSPSVHAPLLAASAPSALASTSHQDNAKDGDRQQEQHRQQQQQQQQQQRWQEDGPGTLPAAWRHGLQQLLHTVAAALATVFSQELRRTTLLLYCVWFTNAITYYGLVLLTTALQTSAKKEECTPQGAAAFDASDFAVSVAVGAAGCRVRLCGCFSFAGCTLPLSQPPLHRPWCCRPS